MNYPRIYILYTIIYYSIPYNKYTTTNYAYTSRRCVDICIVEIVRDVFDQWEWNVLIRNIKY